MGSANSIVAANQGVPGAHISPWYFAVAFLLIVATIAAVALISLNIAKAKLPERPEHLDAEADAAGRGGAGASVAAGDEARKGDRVSTSASVHGTGLGAAGTEQRPPGQESRRTPE